MNIIRGIYLKKRHVQTFRGIIHVCQAILKTGSGRKWSHNGYTAGIFDLPDHGFLLLTWSTGPMEWSTGNSYQAKALVNVLRYHTWRSSQPEDRKLPITELKWDARTLTDIPRNTGHWFFAFFWLTEGSRNKTRHIYKAKTPAHIFIKIFGYSGRHGNRKVLKT